MRTRPPPASPRSGSSGTGSSKRSRGIEGATVFPSEANFVLFQPPGDAKAIWQGLLDRGVLVRDLTEVVPNALRVTAGTPHEVDLFLKSLEEVLA